MRFGESKILGKLAKIIDWGTRGCGFGSLEVANRPSEKNEKKRERRTESV